MVERYVDVDERYVQFFSQVFIPFEQGIADVVASEDNIRKGNRRSRGVFEDFRRFACQSLLFEEFHVAHVDAAVGTDVLVVTFVFSNFEHGRSTVTGTDTSCVSFRIDDGDVHSRAEFRRSDRSGPANEAAFFFRFTCVFIDFRQEVTKGFLGAHAFNIYCFFFTHDFVLSFDLFLDFIISNQSSSESTHRLGMQSDSDRNT